MAPPPAPPTAGLVSGYDTESENEEEEEENKPDFIGPRIPEVYLVTKPLLIYIYSRDLV